MKTHTALLNYSYKSLGFLPSRMQALVFHHHLMHNSRFLHLCINSFRLSHYDHYKQFPHNLSLSALCIFPHNIKLWHLQSDSGHKRSESGRVCSYQNDNFTTNPTDIGGHKLPLAHCECKHIWGCSRTTEPSDRNRTPAHN